MLYLQRRPAAPLDQFIRSLWYTQSPDLPPRQERILPTGCVQVILSLARDYLLDCPAAESQVRVAPSLVVGARTVYELVDSSDMAELVGMVFRPAGFAAFSPDAVHLFSNQNASLRDVWGTSVAPLRERLRETAAPEAKFRVLEDFLLTSFTPRLVSHRVVEFALERFGQDSKTSTVEQVAKETGWSMRHFSQVFREQVGLTPKAWCRVQRFQQAVRQLHAGVDLPWSQLALDCGYYDQSHFANEFRAFSGIDATTYSARRGRWANHVPVG